VSKGKLYTGILALLLTHSLMPFGWPSTWAAEEPFPSKPINIVVGMAPGGGSDTQAKIMGDRMGEILGQPVLRVHKPGGGGIFAASYVARSKADGYTLFTGTSSNLIVPTVLKKLDYTWEDFIPLGIYSKGVVHLYVRGDSPYKTLEDFIREGKKRPMKVSSYGKNSSADFVIEMFGRLAGIKLAHVPYKSCTEASTALLGGHVDGDFCTSAIGQVESGAVRILAIADNERAKFYPEVRTFKEIGYPVSLPLWYSICVPKNTPKKIVDILAHATQEAFKRFGKEITEDLRRMDAYAFFLDSPQSIETFRQDYELTSKIVKELGVSEK